MTRTFEQTDRQFCQPKYFEHYVWAWPAESELNMVEYQSFDQNIQSLLSISQTWLIGSIVIDPKKASFIEQGSFYG